MEAHNNVPVEEAALEEFFGTPEGKEINLEADPAQEVAVSTILSVVPRTFTFRESSGTPGRILEQSVAIPRPPNAGFFTTIFSINAAFTTPDFRFLTERPLGQYLASVGLRGDNFVCTVRLTDSNQDDPIFISVSGIVVFFQ
jgi:hypothetical protein